MVPWCLHSTSRAGCRKIVDVLASRPRSACKDAEVYSPSPLGSSCAQINSTNSTVFNARCISVILLSLSAELVEDSKIWWWQEERSARRRIPIMYKCASTNFERLGGLGSNNFTAVEERYPEDLACLSSIILCTHKKEGQKNQPCITSLQHELRAYLWHSPVCECHNRDVSNSPR